MGAYSARAVADFPINAITEFQKEHWFLSNSSNAPISVNGIVYPSNEHALAAMQTIDLGLRAAIAQLPTPSAAADRAKQLSVRPDWPRIEIDVMRQLVFQKFTQHPNHGMFLLETGARPLIAGNYMHENRWGIDLMTNEGSNWLGLLLMERRARLRMRIFDGAQAHLARSGAARTFGAARVDDALLRAVTAVLGSATAQRFYHNPARLREHVFPDSWQRYAIRSHA